MNILDTYVKEYPTNQNILDIFKGDWVSKMPEPSGLITLPGSSGLFEDARVTWASEIFGSFDSWKILELGPLEGGHSRMLQNMGAYVTAVEANTKAFLKCLCIKEIFKLNSVEFKLGDFMEFLRGDNSEYDMVFASGVLYHMEEPIELIKNISKVTDRVFLWTQYYDDKIIKSRSELSHKFNNETSFGYEGIIYQCATQAYKDSLNSSVFCGGPQPVSKWLTKDSIIRALRHYGFTDIQLNFEHPEHPNGPALALCASK